MGDSKGQIMDATYNALGKHGYADLSIEKIAEEFEKGKSLIYYHYSDKQELMVSFLDFMVEKMESETGKFEDLEPEEKLDKMLEEGLAIDDPEMKEFRKAMMEMQAQTPHNPEFAEKFQQINDLIQKRFEKILKENNVEKPEIKTEIIISTIEGLSNRSISQENTKNLEKMKEEIKRYCLQ